jgi:exosome complex RNA-binding protein Csl4
VLQFPCEGCIRREDVRATATEEAPIQDSFLPGDVVLARILSLGDARRYMLTTASPALGVIHAVSTVSGRPMVPSSWKEMSCPITGNTEPRKVAKPNTASRGSA